MPKDIVPFDESAVVPSSNQDVPEYPPDPRDGPHDVPAFVQAQIEPHLAKAPLHRELRVTGPEPVSLRQVVKHAYREAKSDDAILTDVANANKIAPHQVDWPLPQGQVVQLPSMVQHHDKEAEADRLTKWNQVHEARKKVGKHKHFIRVNEFGRQEEY